MKAEVTKVAVVGGWVAALMTGCSMIPSVGPTYEEPEFEIGEWRLPDAGQPTTNLTETFEYAPAATNDDLRLVVSNDTLRAWWRRFDDPVLVSLVEGGLSNNVSFLMAQKRVEQRDWELLGSYASFLPKLSAGADWTRSWKNRMVPGNGNGRNGYAYNAQLAGLDGSWELDVFGGSRRATESAYASAEAAEWRLAEAWVDLQAEIGVEYVNLRTTQELIDVARTNLALQSETFSILKSRLDSGIGDELALNQCAYIVEQTRANIPTLLAQEERQKNALAVLAGEIPGALDDLLRPLAVRREWLLTPQKVAGLKLDLMRARPDVKAAERELAAATALIGVAKAQWFPKLLVTGTVGYQSQDRTRLFDRGSFFASLGPSVSWPIFQGGAIYANVKATEARMDELALAYALALEKAYGEVRDCYCAYTQQYHRYQSLRSAVKAATDAVTISQDLYRNGLKDFNNVLEAQRSRLNFEEQFAQSRGQITIELIRLYRALGGGLAADGEADEPAPRE